MCLFPTVVLSVERIKQRFVFAIAYFSLVGNLMQRIIEITVSPKGETTLQTKGYIGGACLQASKFLEQSLGITSNDRKTGEFFQATSMEQHVQQ